MPFQSFRTVVDSPSPHPVGHGENAGVSSPVFAEREGVQFRLVETVQGFMDLEAQWRDLFSAHAGAAQVFQSYGWNKVWVDHYLNKCRGDAVRLAIVTGWRDGRLVLLLPLAVYRLLGARVLRFMGGPVSQYGDGVVDRQRASDAVIEDAISFAAGSTRCDGLDLRRVRADAHVAGGIARLGGCVAKTTRAPFVDLSRLEGRGPQRFEHYFRRFSGQSRKQRRKRRRQLDALGPVSFQIMEPGCCAAIEARQAVAAKRAQLKASGKISLIVEDERFEAFFVDVVRLRDEAAQTRVAILSCGDTVVAREIGIVCGAGYSAHLGVFDPSFARYAPGRLQIDDMIAWCLEHEMETFDLLAPVDAYKLEFADSDVVVRDYVHGLTWRGVLLDRVVLRGALPVARRAKDALPGLKLSAMRRRLYRALIPQSWTRTIAKAPNP